MEDSATDKMRFFQFGDSIIGRSLPDTVTFLGEEFFVDFFFNDEELTEIELDPLLSDVTAPGYPDEKYQQIKWEYGVNLLKNAFGVPDYEDESVVRYDFEMGIYHVISI